MQLTPRSFWFSLNQTGWSKLSDALTGALLTLPRANTTRFLFGFFNGDTRRADKFAADLSNVQSCTLVLRRSNETGTLIYRATKPASEFHNPACTYADWSAQRDWQVGFELSKLETNWAPLADWDERIWIAVEIMLADGSEVTVGHGTLQLVDPGIDTTDPITQNVDMKASQEEAEAGEDNSKWMTPLRVHQAIEENVALLAPVQEAPIDDIGYVRYNGGWAPIASGNPFDQSLNTTDTPTFAGIDLGNGVQIDSAFGLSATGTPLFWNAQNWSLSNTGDISGNGQLIMMGAASFADGEASIDDYGNANFAGLTINGQALGNPFDQSLNIADNPYFDSGGAGFEPGGFFVNGAGITPGFGIYIGNDYTRSSNVNIRTDGNATFGKGAVNASDTGLFIQTTSGYAVIGDCYYGINASMLLDSNTGSGAFANSICVGGAGGGADFNTPTTAFKEDGTAFIGGGISFDGTTGTASFASGAATIDASGNASFGSIDVSGGINASSLFAPQTQGGGLTTDGTNLYWNGTQIA